MTDSQKMTVKEVDRSNFTEKGHQRKTKSMEGDFTLRKPQRKTTIQEDNLTSK